MDGMTTIAAAKPAIDAVRKAQEEAIAAIQQATQKSTTPRVASPPATIVPDQPVIPSSAPESKQPEKEEKKSASPKILLMMGPWAIMMICCFWAAVLSYILPATDITSGGLGLTAGCVLGGGGLICGSIWLAVVRKIEASKTGKEARKKGLKKAV